MPSKKQNGFFVLFLLKYPVQPINFKIEKILAIMLKFMPIIFSQCFSIRLLSPKHSNCISLFCLGRLFPIFSQSAVNPCSMCRSPFFGRLILQQNNATFIKMASVFVSKRKGGSKMINTLQSSKGGYGT